MKAGRETEKTVAIIVLAILLFISIILLQKSENEAQTYLDGQYRTLSVVLTFVESGGTLADRCELADSLGCIFKLYEKVEK